MGMTSLTRGTPETAGHRLETAGHTKSTALLERAGLLQHIRHSPWYKGTQRGAPKWLQEDKGTSLPCLLHQPGARHL